MGKRVYKSATSKYVLTCHRVFPQLVSVSCIKPSQVRATLPSMVSVEYDHSLRLNFGGINNRSDQQLSSHVQVQWNKIECDLPYDLSCANGPEQRKKDISTYQVLVYSKVPGTVLVTPHAVLLRFPGMNGPRGNTCKMCYEIRIE